MRQTQGYNHATRLRLGTWRFHHMMLHDSVYDGLIVLITQLEVAAALMLRQHHTYQQMQTPLPLSPIFAAHLVCCASD